MTDPLERAEQARSMLFVPGNRPDRFERATDSGTDEIVLDLEDAVGPRDKTHARQHVAAWLSDGRHAAVRINPPGTAWHDDDLAMLRRHRVAVLLPKATTAAQVSEIARGLTRGSGVLPILESADGIIEAHAICQAEGVVRAIFGNGDLSAQLGVHHADRTALAYAQGAVVIAAAAAGIAAPLDGVTTHIDDDLRVEDDARHAARLGFGGKMCIHPRQISPVHRAFAPADAQVEWARRVTALADDEGAATAVDGEMIDAPLLRRAHALLARHDQSKPTVSQQPDAPHEYHGTSEHSE